ncbi:MAG: hypothetical protein IJ867_04025 [Clostridia bacterium]|nr:hypothetical protein [Clostridia bacterium]
MKNKKGITLIALIITIIVLLILAGISISLVVGDNGVLTRTQEASEKTGKASAVEDVELAYTAVLAKYYEESVDNVGLDKYEYINESRLSAEVESHGAGTIRNFRKDEATGEIKVKYIPNGKDNVYDITIDQTGKAIIRDAVATYTIVFAKEDGTVLQTEELEEGVIPTYQGETPTKTGSIYRYEFTGWDSEITEVTGDKTYTAQFSSTALSYGKQVPLGDVYVTDNSGTSSKLLQGWQFFYDDGTNIYLIYENYLENAQIPVPEGKGISSSGYNVWSEENKWRLVGYLRGSASEVKGEETTSVDFTGTWDGFAEGVRTALKDNLEIELAAGTVTATGAPTLEQFAGSYQTNHPEDEFAVAYRSIGDYIDPDFELGGTVADEGYVYTKGGVGYGFRYGVSLNNSNKPLFFPETANKKETDAQSGPTYGYWLARPSSSGRSKCVRIRLRWKYGGSRILHYSLWRTSGSFYPKI